MKPLRSFELYRIVSVSVIFFTVLNILVLVFLPTTGDEVSSKNIDKFGHFQIKPQTTNVTMYQEEREVKEEEEVVLVPENVYIDPLISEMEYWCEFKNKTTSGYSKGVEPYWSIIDCSEPYHQMNVLVYVHIYSKKRYIAMRSWMEELEEEIDRIGEELSLYVKVITFSSVIKEVDVYVPGKNTTARNVNDRALAIGIMKHVFSTYVEDFHWFLKMDDDTFLWPKNFIPFVRSLSITNKDPLYLGAVLDGGEGKDVWCSGGAGYMYNQASLLRFFRQNIMVEKYPSSPFEDVFMRDGLRDVKPLDVPSFLNVFVFMRYLEWIFLEMYPSEGIKLLARPMVIENTELNTRQITAHFSKDEDEMLNGRKFVHTTQSKSGASRIEKVVRLLEWPKGTDVYEEEYYEKIKRECGDRVLDRGMEWVVIDSKLDLKSDRVFKFLNGFFPSLLRRYYITENSTSMIRYLQLSFMINHYTGGYVLTMDGLMSGVCNDDKWLEIIEHASDISGSEKRDFVVQLSSQGDQVLLHGGVRGGIASYYMFTELQGEEDRDFFSPGLFLKKVFRKYPFYLKERSLEIVEDSVMGFKMMKHNYSGFEWV